MITMSSDSHESRLRSLELQLEEALQMLRLAAQNQRTCLEIEEWLDNNHPRCGKSEQETIRMLMGSCKR